MLLTSDWSPTSKTFLKRVENRPESLSQVQTKSNQKERRIHHEKIVYDRALALSALWQGNADQFGISTEQGQRQIVPITFKEKN